MIKKVLLGLVILGSFGSGAVLLLHKNSPDKYHEPLSQAKPYAPATVPPTSPSHQPPPIVTPIPPPSQTLPSEVNLAVPFVLQAPKQNWDAVHEDLCEEAAALMAANYVLGKGIPNADYADQQLFAIKDFEEQRFGYWKDTTAEETAVIVREYFKVSKTEVVYDPTVVQIKQALADGKVVVVPAAGRQLGNPYFTAPGPLYHMLVIKGYTKSGNFITNEPGTRHGADYIYTVDVVMNAMHDWNGGDVVHGRKVIIVVG